MATLTRKASALPSAVLCPVTSLARGGQGGLGESSGSNPGESGPGGQGTARDSRNLLAICVTSVSLV
jgi:hypothetical protein